jgi:hypothetical protein
MKNIFKKFFIPHRDNNYHPHILHTKRALCYSAFFVLLKCGVFAFALLLPLEVFVLPDVLVAEQNKLYTYTNTIRNNNTVQNLNRNAFLITSAQMKTRDMVDGEYFSHISPKGRGLSYFVSNSGYKYSTVGENLAMGFTTAEDIIEAWKASPTHYQNLIDSEFNDIGIFMQSGVYNGVPTVYVAQHFGKKVGTKKSVGSLKVVLDEKVEEKKIVVEKKAEEDTSVTRRMEVEDISARGELVNVEEVVLGEKENNIYYDVSQSYLEWKEVDSNSIQISANVSIIGDVEDVSVAHSKFTMPLVSQKKGEYTGTIILENMSVDSLFHVITPASIIGKVNNKEMIKDIIPWREVYIASPTPMEKYVKAKKTLTPITSIFDMSKGIFIGFLLFFSIALLLNIFIEIKKQHHHIIGQTMALMILLISCVFI